MTAGEPDTRRVRARIEQHARASERLWVAGSAADGLRMSVSALQDAAALAHRVGLPLDDDTSRLVDSCANRTLPELDAEVSESDRDLHARVRSAVDVVLRDLERTADRQGLRAHKRTLVAGVLLLLLVIAIVGARWPRIRASATARYDERFVPAKAIDGDPQTEWLLPDGAAGTLQLDVSPARKITRVRLLNAHNPGYDDRGTREWTVHLFHEGKEVRTFDGSFPQPPKVVPWTAVMVDAVRVDRIRIDVRSFYGASGGLAEVEVE